MDEEREASLSLGGRGLLGLLSILIFIFERISIERALALGARLGSTWDRVGAPRTRRVREQLAMAMPEVAASRREEWAREVFLHLGRALSELVLLGGRRREALLDRVEVVGLEHVELAERESPTGGRRDRDGALWQLGIGLRESCGSGYSNFRRLP